MRKLRDAKHLIILCLAGLALALSACATPTPYGPATSGTGISYGYKEQRIEADRFRVTVTGNSITPRETVENYLLYRAAELTRRNGFADFIIVEKDIERKVRHYPVHSSFGMHFGSSFFHRHHFHSFGSGHTFQRDWYVATAVILMTKSGTREDNANRYRAADVLKRLAPTIRRAPPS